MSKASFVPQRILAVNKQSKKTGILFTPTNLFIYGFKKKTISFWIHCPTAVALNQAHKCYGMSIIYIRKDVFTFHRQGLRHNSEFKRFMEENVATFNAGVFGD